MIALDLNGTGNRNWPLRKTIVVDIVGEGVAAVRPIPNCLPRQSLAIVQKGVKLVSQTVYPMLFYQCDKGLLANTASCQLRL